MKNCPSELGMYFKELLKKHSVSGLALAKIEDSQLVWADGFGFANTTQRTLVFADTIFEAASLSKPVVAFATLQLCKNQKLNLNDTLAKYLDWDVDSRITVKHVLTHTSGLANWIEENENPQPQFTPGSRFSYSGVGYRVLQEAIEKITNQPLEQYLNETLFTQLEMQNSSFTWRSDFAEKYATGHDTNGLPIEKFQPNKAFAAFSLHSTVSDLSKFVIAFLKSHLRTQMLEPHVIVNNTVPWKKDWSRDNFEEFLSVFWGLGWGLEQTKNEQFFWQWGNNGNFKAFALTSSSTGNGFIALTNGANGDRLWRELTDKLVGGEHPLLNWLEQTEAIPSFGESDRI